jgi:hypothetical protein
MGIIQKTKTNPYSTAPSPTHRVGLTESEILGLLEVLHDTKVTTGLSRVQSSAALKLNNVYEKSQLGMKAADYVPSGKMASKSVSLSNLGATESEAAEFIEGKYNNSPEMDSATAAQLDWMIQCTQEESKNPPDISEFMKGGKYYEQWNQESKIEQAGISSSGANCTSSNGNSADDIGTDCFLEPGSEDQDIELGKLFDRSIDKDKPIGDSES